MTQSKPVAMGQVFHTGWLWTLNSSPQQNTSSLSHKERAALQSSCCSSLLKQLLFPFSTPHSHSCPLVQPHPRAGGTQASGGTCGARRQLLVAIFKKLKHFLKWCRLMQAGSERDSNVQCPGCAVKEKDTAFQDAFFAPSLSCETWVTPSA